MLFDFNNLVCLKIKIAKSSRVICKNEKCTIYLHP